MAAHALLGPSSAKRWLICTASPTVLADVLDEGSVAALYGTLIHTVGEMQVREKLHEIGLGLCLTPDQLTEMIRAREHGLWDGEAEEIARGYADYVVDRYLEIRSLDPCAELLLERRVSYDHIAQGQFGTADAIICGAGRLIVIDLKTGKGVKVEVIDNPQAKLYAIGAVQLMTGFQEFSEVEVVIYQPRVFDLPQCWTTTVEELTAWGEEITPAAREALTGPGTFVAGPHCHETFCAVRHTCAARAAYETELCDLEFAGKPADQLTPEQIAEVLMRAEGFTRWVSDVKEWAQARAVEGTRFPAMKLVEGRSNRRITDWDSAKTRLNEAGFEDAVLHKPIEPLGITELEKTVGKKAFASLLDGLIEKPAGKPTLVPATDPRPEWTDNNSADAEFSE